MITPEQLESYGYGNEEIFAGLEQRIMDDIVRRIKDAGVITRSADFQINELRRLGFSNADIKSMLQDALDASDAYIDELYQTAIETDYISNKQLYDALDKRFIPFKQNTWLQNMISAAKNQTKAEMHNLSNSLGFVIRTKDGTMNMTLTEYYQRVIDQAIVDIQTGGFDYNRTLRKAVKQMSNSGIRWINYDTGWHNRITVAARRSVMTAISQMSVNISDDTAKKLGIDTFEISAHANPRPTHAVWQGTVKTKLQLIEECGLGSVTGLLGANCYHVYYPFVKGVSKRAYTDEQLRKWADPTPKTYKGKEYTGYEAKQRMRQMETNMRAMREEIRMLQEGGGDPEDILNAQVRYRTAMYEYGDFAKKMGMKQQKERIYMDGLGNVVVSKNGQNQMNLKLLASRNTPSSVDRDQFARYSKVLGADFIPNSIEEFVKKKYTDSSWWQSVKADYRLVNQYQNHTDSLMNAKKVIQLHNEAYDLKRNKFPSKFKKDGNIGIMELDGKMYYAYSAASAKEDKAYRNFRGDKAKLILLPEQQTFKTKKIGNHDRIVDSEAKLFEYAASICDDEKNHELLMLSELPSCESCLGVLEQFQKRYPRVKVQLISTKEERMKRKYGDNRKEVYRNAWRK